jgi:hypothetical protein
MWPWVWLSGPMRGYGENRVFPREFLKNAQKSQDFEFCVDFSPATKNVAHPSPKLAVKSRARNSSPS